jgi:glycosyltransferase involved in cell wall biosynthesis
MRVFLVSHRFPPDGVAGVERYTQALAAELRRGGEAVAVAARRWSADPPVPTLAREQLPDGTAVYRFVGGGTPDLRDFMRHRERLERLFTAATLEAAPDVVHVNHLLGLPPRLPEIARRLGAAVVLSLHDFFPACPLAHLQKPGGELCRGPDGGRECARTCFADDGPGGWVRWGLRAAYFRRLPELADRVICYSRFVASYFEGYGLDPTRLRVVPLGVPEELARRAGPAFRMPARRGELNLAYCGTVVLHKGPRVILEALRVAGLGPVLLRLVGQAPDEPHVRRYVEGLRRQAAEIPGLRLEIHGAYEPHELPGLLADTDCVIVPSLVPETGGLVPREALALGVPVLVSRLGALPELVSEGENGFTFDPGRPAHLADRLRRLAADEGLLARLRDGARRTRVVTAAGHAAAVRAVYEEALAHRRAGGTPDGDAPGRESLHAALVRAAHRDTAAPAANAT